jgi:uncharacterized protein (DUF4415 family)
MAKSSRSSQSKPPGTQTPGAKTPGAAKRQAPAAKTQSRVATAKAAPARAAAEPDRADWATGLVFDVREPKLAVSLRLDADVLRFFRGYGAGYQTRINEVLKAFMQARGGAETVGAVVAGARASRTSGGNGKRAAR